MEHVFLFPAHTFAGGYDMPEREIEAFRRVIRPRLGGVAARAVQARIRQSVAIASQCARVSVAVAAAVLG